MKQCNNPSRSGAAPFVAILAAMTCLAIERSAMAQITFDRRPIYYSSPKTNNPVAELQKQINAGKLKLEFDKDHGYLRSVLKRLGISPSSQMLVFSKTSFQLRRIAPWSPRALYFNDNTYVGWVPHGDVIEVSSVDPQKGAIFYRLSQQESSRPRFSRDTGNCLTCHATSRTYRVPGHLVRSVYPSRSGRPHFGAGTFRTNQTSPLKQRWGGWYVTGTHGRQRHMGNVVSRDRSRPEKLDVEAGANVTNLAKLTNTNLYLTKHSDIVALMILEHQTDMHNFITFANFEARQALDYEAEMNRILNRPRDFTGKSTRRRIAAATEKLLKYMLFVDEAALTDKIQGTSGFTKMFAALGPRDKQGRSLRDFDLRGRVFKYPCSYLIYSKPFRGLPAQVKNQVYRQLFEILTGKDKRKAFKHLTSVDRIAILEILRDTNSDLPKYWKTAK